MQDNDTRVELARRLSEFGILLAADVTDTSIGEVDINILLTKIMELKNDSAGPIKIVSNSEIIKIVKDIEEISESAKAPIPIEVNRSSGFVPFASEISADYRILNNNSNDVVENTSNGFVTYFRNRLEKIRRIFEERMIPGLIQDLGVLKKYTDGREVLVSGMVSNKITTKNGNIMVVIEDENAEAKIIFMNSNSIDGKKLFESANKIINDEVIVIKGKVSGPFVIAKEFLWPDIKIKERNSVCEDFAIAFISDIHIGSKLFMEQNFLKMIDWLNGNGVSKELAGKVKYLVVGGDIVDGIGVYPDQYKDLAVPDIYKQYKIFSRFLELIPDYIHVFVIPGNHDAVQKAEPQPEIPEELFGSFKDNVHLIRNPSYISLHGINVLTYHGASLDSMISKIPNLSYSKPEEVMIEILKRRHLSPIYGGNEIAPLKNDNLVISDIPDILHMGHIHKNGDAMYKGVNIINSGTWQGRTDFQIRQGHIPTPCKLPVFEAKKYDFTMLDFNS